MFNSTYFSFCQESLVYANRSLEAALGEKVLRDNKEQRDQQNRLKEIDHQLKSLERNLVSLLFLLYISPLSLKNGLCHSICLKIKWNFATSCKFLKESPKKYTSKGRK